MSLPSLLKHLSVLFQLGNRLPLFMSSACPPVSMDTSALTPGEVSGLSMFET